MVTKLLCLLTHCLMGSVLAKIHMVTKQDMGGNRYWQGSVLAKIHMVTKR